MNREMRRLMEREERLQKRDKANGGGSGRGPRRPRPGGSGGVPPGAAGERLSIFARLGSFLHEVRQELKKVSWPSREQMIAFTTVTLIVTIVLTLVIFGLDIAMKETVINLLTRT